MRTCAGAIVVWDRHGVANDGRPYDNSCAWVLRMRDGNVINGTAFYFGQIARVVLAEEAEATARG